MKTPDSVLERATLIATEIMTMDFGGDNPEICDRIALMKRRAKRERELGGRNTVNVVEIIERHLRTYESRP